LIDFRGIAEHERCVVLQRTISQQFSRSLYFEQRRLATNLPSPSVQQLVNMVTFN
jgi:hypothetical protein